MRKKLSASMQCGCHKIPQLFIRLRVSSPVNTLDRILDKKAIYNIPRALETSVWGSVSQRKKIKQILLGKSCTVVRTNFEKEN